MSRIVDCSLHSLLWRREEKRREAILLIRESNTTRSGVMELGSMHMVKRNGNVETGRMRLEELN